LLPSACQRRADRDDGMGVAGFCRSDRTRSFGETRSETDVVAGQPFRRSLDMVCGRSWFGMGRSSGRISSEIGGASNELARHRREVFAPRKSSRFASVSVANTDDATAAVPAMPLWRGHRIAGVVRWTRCRAGWLKKIA
jgi:hypothetical protein